MKRRILIIENNSTLLRAYHHWLSLIGYQVQLADTMWAATALLDSHHHDVVVYDIDGAGSRGVEFLRENWLQFKIEGTRVAVISHSGQFRRECEAMGIPFYSKPSRLKELEQIVVGLLYGELRPAGTRPLPALYS